MVQYFTVRNLTSSYVEKLPLCRYSVNLNQVIRLRFRNSNGNVCFSVLLIGLFLQQDASNVQDVASAERDWKLVLLSKCPNVLLSKCPNVQNLKFEDDFIRLKEVCTGTHGGHHI